MNTATTPPLAINSAVADMLLLRMAMPDASPKKVRDDIGKLLERQLTAADFEDLRNQLVSEGLLVIGPRNSCKVTDAGRERALRFVGLAEFPARSTWSTIVSRQLFSKAVGLTDESAARLNSSDKLGALVLKRKFGLPDAAGSTVTQVAESLACRELGFPEATRLEDVLCIVLSKLVGDERLSKTSLIAQLPLVASGLPKAGTDGYRRNLVRQWLASCEAPACESSAPVADPPPAELLDLPTFAATVRALAAGSSAEDRFHDNKVYIAALWRASQKESSFPRLALEEFKRQLVEASLRDLLHLSRADLVQAMDPQLVADSETTYLNATFHFVLLEGVAP